MRYTMQVYFDSSVPSIYVKPWNWVWAVCDKGVSAIIESLGVMLVNSTSKLVVSSLSDCQG